MNMEDKKIFEEAKVECTDCTHYWDDSCDGVPENKERTCTSFVATKRIDLVKRLEELESYTIHLNKSLLFFYIILILHLLSTLIWR